MGRGDDWLNFALHNGLEACELHFCTMRPYCIRHSLVPISEHLYFCYARAFLEYLPL